MIVNQKVKLKGTDDYGYILTPIEIDIIWENTKQKGKAMLNELEFIDKELQYFIIKENKR